ncbi:MAG TPA: DUF5597 domain-containing protein [Terriglobia bacterium]|nr:DUF5597 domain-containing protein [Terriglobia bacterium]
MLYSRSRNLFLLSAILTWTFSSGPLRPQTNPPTPQVVHTGTRYQLLVDGKPFLMLGGQAHNSSASNPRDLEPVWRSLTAMHANTAEVPIYWELIEPEPGHFDFHLIDSVIQGARTHGLKLVLLWFGTWKNGEMTYTPSWVKEDPVEFFRVRNEVGQPMQIISPFCAAAREADAKAFAAVMQHIRSVDQSEHTVIMMQVENETGLLGTDRDYSPQATQEYKLHVPQPLITYLQAHRGHLMPALEQAWAASHYAASGTWEDVFGDLAPEAFSAWYVARYVNAVAAAGKAQYPLPMYCNNWLAGPGAARAGDWPSGGPTIHVLDIWKAAAPSIDILAPDIYIPEFLETSAEFHRPDNPLFVPETAFAPGFASYVFPTLAEFNGIGFSPFGIDFAVGADGKLNAQGQALAENYALLQPLLPLIEKYQYSGKLFSIVQGVDNANVIKLGHELAAVVSYSQGPGFPPAVPDTYREPRAGGIMIELASDDYIVAGSGFRVDFRNLRGPSRSPEFLSIDRGTFRGDQWQTEQRLNGDEQHVNLLRRPGILRVRLYNVK